MTQKNKQQIFGIQYLAECWLIFISVYNWLFCIKVKILPFHVQKLLILEKIMKMRA